MANDSLMACSAASTPAVIPAKAGIHPHHKARYATSTALDTRLRGYDGIKSRDELSNAVEIFGAGV